MSCHVEAVMEGIIGPDAAIASLDFARDGGCMSGSVPVARLERLADLLADDEGVLDCALRGGIDAEGKPYLALTVGGSLNLRCQRCLAALPFAVGIESRLMLMAPGADWPDDELEEEGSDAIEASAALAVLPLIEDEVLLALPIAPRHEDCRPPAFAQAAEMEQRRSPFAALAKLKDH
jgi:uncharacterized protein